MKFLFDLFPILLFFIAYKLGSIYIATGVAMAATVGQLLWLKLRRRPIEVTHWLNLGVILVFGGATLWLQNPTFIKWKPSVLYWAFAAILLGGIALGKNPLGAVMGKQLTLEAPIWRKLNIVWALFFLAVGVINIVVAYHYDEATWVNFKLFGLTGLLVVFAVAQALWLSKHLPSDTQDKS